MAAANLSDLRIAQRSAEMLRFSVYVKPKASKTKVVGVHDGALALAIAAPPVDGAANDELLRFLASTLGVPRRCLDLAAGASSRRKTVEIQGMLLVDLMRRLQEVTP